MRAGGASPRPARRDPRRGARRGATRRGARHAGCGGPSWPAPASICASRIARTTLRAASACGPRPPDARRAIRRSARTSRGTPRQLARGRGRPDAGLGSCAMRAGLFLAYWPWFTPEEQVELAVLADELGLDSVWVSEAWGQDAVSVLGLLAGKTERVALGSGLLQIPARAAGRDRDGRGDARRAVATGASGSGSACPGPQVSEGWYGVPFARPVAPHARVRRDRPHGAGPQDARPRGPRVPRAAATGAQAAEAARQAGAGADPDLPRRRRPEGGRAGRRDRRRLAAVHARPGARRARCSSRWTAGSRRPGRTRADIDVAACTAMARRGRPRRGARRRAPVAGVLPRRDGRARRRTSTSSSPSARATATRRASARRRSSAATASAPPAR